MSVEHLTTQAFPEVNLAVFDNKVYSLQAVDLPVNEVIKQIKEFYEGNYNRLKSEITDEKYEEAVQDWQNQIRHLERISRTNIAVIPENLYGKAVIYYNNSVCEMRTVQYKPVRITSDAHGLLCNTRSDSRRARAGFTKVWNAVKDMPADARISITIEQNIINFPMVFAYSVQRNKVYTPFIRGFHSMTDRDLCTGDFSGTDFWNHAEFDKLVNVINYFSLATDRVYFNSQRDGDSVYAYDLLKDEYVVSVEREALWRV